MKLFAFGLATILLVTPALVQDSALISADNVRSLGSDVQLDFSQLDLSAGSGSFVTNADASVIVTFASEENAAPLSTAVIWDGRSGEIIKTLFVGENPYDQALSDDSSQLAIARHDGIILFDLSTGQSQQILGSNARILSVWFTDKGAVCGESAPDVDNSQAFILCSDGREPVLVYGVENADYVRIGRVPPPLSVTSAEDGTVNLWNLETGEVIRQANVGEIAAFGAINPQGTALVWRDPMSERLNLLDFTTGENRRIAELGGDYIAYLLLSSNADVVFGIDSMSARGHVWAWLAQAGEKLDLGTFRACERPQPDLAGLSADGTALIIGCDLGIDVWRADASQE